MATLWLLGATVLAGLGLATLWMLERRPGKWARLGSAAHGLAGATGTALVLTLLWQGARDQQGLGRMAGWFLGLALTGGGIVLVAQLRRRRAPGLAVALHATLGLAGFVVLLAYASVSAGR